MSVAAAAAREQTPAQAGRPAEPTPWASRQLGLLPPRPRAPWPQLSPIPSPRSDSRIPLTLCSHLGTQRLGPGLASLTPEPAGVCTDPQSWAPKPTGPCGEGGQDWDACPSQGAPCGVSVRGLWIGPPSSNGRCRHGAKSERRPWVPWGTCQCLTWDQAPFWGVLGGFSDSFSPGVPGPW